MKKDLVSRSTGHRFRWSKLCIHKRFLKLMDFIDKVIWTIFHNANEVESELLNDKKNLLHLKWIESFSHSRNFSGCKLPLIDFITFIETVNSYSMPTHTVFKIIPMECFASLTFHIFTCCLPYIIILQNYNTIATGLHHRVK